MSAEPDADDGARDSLGAGPQSVQPDVDLDSLLPTVGNKLPLGMRLGEYELTDVLGEGGFGIVYLAVDHSLQRQVAIKEYIPAALARRGPDLRVEIRDEHSAESFKAGLRSFVNEAKLLARFDHPALLKVHRFWQDRGTAYMVMPYYQGVTLKKALAERGAPPDEPWLREMVAPVMDALEYLHAASCYHRDIAPDNIILVDGGRPLLLDFGAARRLIGDMNKAVTVILKSGYAPIEQYGETPGLTQGPWTDIYALGAVLHFAITGKVPRASVSRLLSDKDPPLAERAAGRYSAQLLQAIDRMLEVQPMDRPQTIGELRTLLGAEAATTAKAAKPARAKPHEQAASPRSRARRVWMLPVLAGVTTLLALLGAAWLIWPAISPSRSPLPTVTEAPAVAPTVAMSPPAAATTAPQPASATAPLATPAPTPNAEPAFPVPVAQPAAEAGAATAPSPPALSAAPAPAPSPAPSSVIAATPPAAPVARTPVAAPPIAAGEAPTTPRRSARQGVAAAPPGQATAKPAPPPRITDRARCADIVQRVSIGEALSEEDRRVLKEECGR